MQAPRRIDTHHHFIPPRYLAAVGAEAIGRTLVSGRAPEWTPRHSIEAMDRHGIVLGQPLTPGGASPWSKTATARPSRL